MLGEPRDNRFADGVHVAGDHFHGKVLLEPFPPPPGQIQSEFLIFQQPAQVHFDLGGAALTNDQSGIADHFTQSPGIGGDQGQFVERLRDCRCDLPIISIDPLPACHGSLNALAAKDPGLTVFRPAAPGSAPGHARLHQYGDSSLSSFLDPTEALKDIDILQVRQEVEVEVATLDAIWEELGRPFARPFLKIDVQGFERAVTEGGGETFETASGLLMEIGLVAMYEGEDTCLTLLQAADALGFTPVYICPVIRRRRLGILRQVDVLFFSKDHPVMTGQDLSEIK